MLMRKQDVVYISYETQTPCETGEARTYNLLNAKVLLNSLSIYIHFALTTSHKINKNHCTLHISEYQCSPFFPLILPSIRPLVDEISTVHDGNTQSICTFVITSCSFLYIFHPLPRCLQPFFCQFFTKHVSLNILFPKLIE